MRSDIKIIYRTVALLCVAGLFALTSGCRQSEKEDSVLQHVCMSFDLRTIDSSAARLREQGNQPSINQDASDREDYVRRLAVFIFATGTDGGKVLDHYTSETQFILNFTPGTYDFYIIANYPISEEASLRSMTKSQLDAYLTTPRSFDVWKSESTTNFPMARIYRNQNIPHGGTPYSPIAFRPTTTVSKQLAPISHFGVDATVGTTQKTVNLVRACAKVSFRLYGKGVDDVVSVQYVNPVLQYTFSEQAPRTNYASLPVKSTPMDITWIKDGGPLGKGNAEQTAWKTRIASFYVPERLFTDTETKGWLRNRATGQDEPIGPVQYLQVTLTHNRIYKIPIVTNGDKKGALQSYLDFVRNGNGTTAQPDFNVVRNKHYHYEILIDQDVYVGFLVADYKAQNLDKVIVYAYGRKENP